MKKTAILAIACVMILATLGCNKGSKLDDLNSVSGVITLDGTPLEGASITLYPTAPGARSAGCISSADGKFKFQTLTSNDGVANGEYQVSVTKMIMENAYTDEEAKIFSEAGGKSHKQVFPGRPEPTPKNELPEKYAKPDTSGLTLSINGPTKELKLELTSN